MITSTKRSVSSLFFFAFVVAGIFIGSTIQTNREVAQRRLVEPVQTVGTLASSECTTHIRGMSGWGLRTRIVLNYQYLTVGSNPTPHVFRTLQGFDKEEDCVAFDKSNISKVTIWYEKEHPEKASLYETEDYTWGKLYGLVLAALFVIGGVYDQKSINKEKRDSQNINRTSNRLKRERKS